MCIIIHFTIAYYSIYVRIYTVRSNSQFSTNIHSFMDWTKISAKIWTHGFFKNVEYFAKISKILGNNFENVQKSRRGNKKWPHRPCQILYIYRILKQFFFHKDYNFCVLSFVRSSIWNPQNGRKDGQTCFTSIVMISCIHHMAEQLWVNKAEKSNPINNS